MPADSLYVMSPMEVVLGFTPGHIGRLSPSTDSSAKPRDVLERLVRAALLRPPCAVAFSGGRDSSAVLAVATHVARRDGLPEPIPVTRVFPGITEAEESRWQELVVRHLGLREWHRMTFHDELDVIGPLARPRLVRHGVLWPATLALDVPVVDAVPNGSVIDGEGGDEVLGVEFHRCAPLADLLRTPRPLRRRRVRAALGAFTPAGLRTRRLREQLGPQITWLKPAGREALLDAFGSEERRRPFGYAASIRAAPCRRKYVLGGANRRSLAARAGVVVSSPLLHPDFVHALAGVGGMLGLGDRASVLRSLVADLLPAELLERTGKGEYTRCYLGRHTREFAQQWQGDGVDHELVDAEMLRDQWLGDPPNAVTAPLLQAAWLATRQAAATDAVG